MANNEQISISEEVKSFLKSDHQLLIDGNGFLHPLGKKSRFLIQPLKNN
jgi:hypothetical protein